MMDNNNLVDQKLLSSLLLECPSSLGKPTFVSHALAEGAARIRFVKRISDMLEVVRTPPEPPPTPSPRCISATLCAFAEARPAVFRDPQLLRNTCSLLESRAEKRRAQGQGLGGEKIEDRPSQALASALVVSALRDVCEWPLELLSIYMSDALEGRQWVEHPDCSLLVQNIRTAWSPSGTDTAPLASEIDQPQVSAANVSNVAQTGDDSSSGEEMDVEDENGVVVGAGIVPIVAHGHQAIAAVVGIQVDQSALYASPGPLVADRYNSRLETAQSIVVGHLVARLEGLNLETEGFSSKALLGATKCNNFTGSTGTTWQVVDTLAELAPLPAARTLAAAHLAKWLQSPAYGEKAQSLLMVLAEALQGNLPSDLLAADTVLTLQVKASQMELHASAIYQLLKRLPVLRRRALSKCLNPASFTRPPETGVRHLERSSSITSMACISAPSEMGRLLVAVFHAAGTATASADLAHELVSLAITEIVEQEKKLGQRGAVNGDAEGPVDGGSARAGLLLALTTLGFGWPQAIDLRIFVKTLLSSSVVDAAVKAGLGQGGRRRLVRTLVVLARIAQAYRAWEGTAAITQAHRAALPQSRMNTSSSKSKVRSTQQMSTAASTAAAWRAQSSLLSDLSGAQAACCTSAIPQLLPPVPSADVVTPPPSGASISPSSSAVLVPDQHCLAALRSLLFLPARPLTPCVVPKGAGTRKSSRSAKVFYTDEVATNAAVASIAPVTEGINLCPENSVLGEDGVGVIVQLAADTSGKKAGAVEAASVLDLLETMVLRSASVQMAAEVGGSSDARQNGSGSFDMADDTGVNGNSSGLWQPSDVLRVEDATLVEQIFELCEVSATEPRAVTAALKAAAQREAAAGNFQEFSVVSVTSMEPPARPVPLPPAPPPVKLAHSDLFWRACIISLVLAATNPSTVGRWAWDTVPTLRCLMQMVVCSQYEFPPPGAMVDSSGAADDVTVTAPGYAHKAMLQADRAHHDVEKAAVELRYGVKSRRPPPPEFNLTTRKKRKVRNDVEPEKPLWDADELVPPRNQSAGIYYSDYIALDLRGPARAPPAPVLMKLSELDAELKMGAKLRRCKDPDFITAVVAGSDPQRVTRDSTERSAEWLISAMAAEPAVIIKRLPLPVAVHLSLLAHSEPQGTTTASSAGQQTGERAAWPSVLRSTLAEPLLGRVARYVWGTDSTAAQRALRLLMEDLSNPLGRRRVAGRRVLQAMLQMQSSASSDATTDIEEQRNVQPAETEEDMHTDLLGWGRCSGGPLATLAAADADDCGWLIRCTRLPCWPAPAALLAMALHMALQHETTTQPIRWYLIALHLFCKDSNNATNPEAAAALSPALFCRVLCQLLHRREMVSSATLTRFPDILQLARRHVAAALATAAAAPDNADHSDDAWSGEPMASLPCTSGMKKVPALLLTSAMALLATSAAGANTDDVTKMDSVSSMDDTTGLDSAPSELRELMELTFPSKTGADGEALGVLGAIWPEGKDSIAAVGPRLWVRLTRGGAVSVAAMPPPLLIRLLLASGLSPDCVLAILRRLDGVAAESGAEAYIEALTPPAASTSGTEKSLGQRTSVAKTLLRRLNAYLRLCSADATSSARNGPFMRWLEGEATIEEGRDAHGASINVTSAAKVPMMSVQSVRVAPLFSAGEGASSLSVPAAHSLPSEGVSQAPITQKSVDSSGSYDGMDVCKDDVAQPVHRVDSMEVVMDVKNVENLLNSTGVKSTEKSTLTDTLKHAGSISAVPVEERHSLAASAIEGLQLGEDDSVVRETISSIMSLEAWVAAASDATSKHYQLNGKGKSDQAYEDAVRREVVTECLLRLLPRAADADVTAQLSRKRRSCHGSQYAPISLLSMMEESEATETLELGPRYGDEPSFSTVGVIQHAIIEALVDHCNGEVLWKAVFRTDPNSTSTPGLVLSPHARQSLALAIMRAEPLPTVERCVRWLLLPAPKDQPPDIYLALSSLSCFLHRVERAMQSGKLSQSGAVSSCPFSKEEVRVVTQWIVAVAKETVPKVAGIRELEADDMSQLLLIVCRAGDGGVQEAARVFVSCINAPATARDSRTRGEGDAEAKIVKDEASIDLLFHLYTTHPSQVAKAIGGDSSLRRIYPLLEHHMAARPISMWPSRCPLALSVLAAAKALAFGAGDESMAGREGHSAFLSATASAHPLMFLTQLPEMEKLLQDDAAWRSPYPAGVQRSLRRHIDNVHPLIAIEHISANTSSPQPSPSGHQTRFGKKSTAAAGMEKNKPIPRVTHVRVRQWGCSFTPQLWMAVLAALQTAPVDVLRGPVGEAAGVPRFWSLFIKLLAVQLQYDGASADAACSLASRLAQTLASVGYPNGEGLIEEEEAEREWGVYSVAEILEMYKAASKRGQSHNTLALQGSLTSQR